MKNNKKLHPEDRVCEAIITLCFLKITPEEVTEMIKKHYKKIEKVD